MLLARRVGVLGVACLAVDGPLPPPAVGVLGPSTLYGKRGLRRPMLRRCCCRGNVSSVVCEVEGWPAVDVQAVLWGMPGVAVVPCALAADTRPELVGLDGVGLVVSRRVQ